MAVERRLRRKRSRVKAISLALSRTRKELRLDPQLRSHLEAQLTQQNQRLQRTQQCREVRLVHDLKKKQPRKTTEERRLVQMETKLPQKVAKVALTEKLQLLQSHRRTHKLQMLQEHKASRCPRSLITPQAILALTAKQPPAKLTLT